MDRSFCVAPMMARTDKHFRYLVRQLTKKAVHFTEMIHTNSILFGNRNKLDDYFQIECLKQIIYQLNNVTDPIAKIINKDCKKIFCKKKSLDGFSIKQGTSDFPRINACSTCK